MSELVPQAGVIALLVNPNNPQIDSVTRDVREAARTKRVQLPILKADTESGIDAAFATLVQLHAGPIVVQSDPFFGSRREQLTALAARDAVFDLSPTPWWRGVDSNYWFRNSHHAA